MKPPKLKLETLLSLVDGQGQREQATTPLPPPAKKKMMKKKKSDREYHRISDERSERRPSRIGVNKRRRLISLNSINKAMGRSLVKLSAISYKERGRLE